MPAHLSGEGLSGYMDTLFPRKDQPCRFSAFEIVREGAIRQPCLRGCRRRLERLRHSLHAAAAKRYEKLTPPTVVVLARETPFSRSNERNALAFPIHRRHG